MKSGGHTLNPGFSSTQGIQIYTGKFSQVTYDAASSTAVIGTGLTWDIVYERLQEYGVVVLGGRAPGVSVLRNSLGQGFLNSVTDRRWWLVARRRLVLGGSPVFLHAHGSRIGYSYKTNQYGLAIDTIVGFNLVLPNGTVTYVTQSTYPDLFWGLKGGFNNFVGLSLSLTSSPFGSTHPPPGDRDRFHNDHIPANRSMGASGPFSTIHREFSLTPITGRASRVPFHRFQSSPHRHSGSLDVFPGPEGCDRSYVHWLPGGSNCRPNSLL